MKIQVLQDEKELFSVSPSDPVEAQKSRVVALQAVSRANDPGVYVVRIEITKDDVVALAKYRATVMAGRDEREKTLADREQARAAQLAALKASKDENK